MIVLHIVRSSDFYYLNPVFVIGSMISLLVFALIVQKGFLFVLKEMKWTKASIPFEKALYKSPDILMQNNWNETFDMKTAVLNRKTDSVLYKTIAIVLGVILFFTQFQDLLRP